MNSLRSDGMITISRFDVIKPVKIETYRFEISNKNRGSGYYKIFNSLFRFKWNTL